MVKTDTFGYTYPETASGSSQSSIKAAINKLYGNTAGSSTVSKGKKNRRTVVDNVNAAASVQAAVSENGTSYQYIANVVSQKFAMGSSYAVYLFLGNYTSDSVNWGTDTNLVGIHGVFANIKSGGASALVQAMGMSDLKGTGSLPLTTMLINKVATGQLASLRPRDVEPYLTANLDWRCAYYDGTEIPVASVLDLSVSVIQSQVQPAVALDEFPVWGQFKSLANVTSGKIGGYSRRYWSPIRGNAHHEVGNKTTSYSGAASSAESLQTITLTTTTFLPLASCDTYCSHSTVLGGAAPTTSA